jgi:hypothetical protein
LLLLSSPVLTSAKPRRSLASFNLQIIAEETNSIERWWWCAVVYKYRDSFGITMSVNASTIHVTLWSWEWNRKSDAKDKKSLGETLRIKTKKKVV